MVRFLVGDDQGFLKEGLQAYQMAPVSPFISVMFFSGFTSIVCEKEQKKIFSDPSRIGPTVTLKTK
jgi:hypothetical protein